MPINFRFTISEVEHIVRDSGAKLLISQKAYAETALALKSLVRLWNFDGEESLCRVIREPGPPLADGGFAGNSKIPA